MNNNNPFEYEAANKFNDSKILEFYIQDYNYSRFIKSRRNIFLIGERGTGKTMTLLYNSFPVQFLKSNIEKKETDLQIISIYVPCNTPLTHKREYQLIDDFGASVISEHFFVLSIMYSITDTLSNIPNLFLDSEEISVKQDIQFVMGISLPQDRPILDSLKMYINREVSEAQRAINAKKLDVFYDNAISFNSGVLPLINCFKNADKLKNSHFSFLIDDAHDLNPHQIETLNSWIAYRDNSLISFKVATAKVDEPSFITSSGGTILEGHDYTVVDMEQPYQNKFSDFGKLARKIIEKRLEQLCIKKTPEEFFPVNKQLETDLEECKNKVKLEAKKKYPDGNSKQISDYVYKYYRAEYFRSRSPKANLPPYSGFEILIHLSTGVIRNLLEPCYWMYDSVISDIRSTPSFQEGSDICVDQIPSNIQTEVIISRSKKKWEWIKNKLDKSIEGCSMTDAEQIYHLFDNLSIHFKERLLKHKSEPRAISFTISEQNSVDFKKVEELLRLARKAQILYTYTSSAKDHGKRETYYVPNRILWPDRGLDPIGQHARVSLKASDLYLAATENKLIELTIDEDKPSRQRSLFDE
ncbi:MAG: hypothetical protein AB7S50_15080 [Bacteroidales bacterium]